MTMASGVSRFSKVFRRIHTNLLCISSKILLIQAIYNRSNRRTSHLQERYHSLVFAVSIALEVHPSP